MAFMTWSRFDSESRMNCAEVTTRCPGSSPARISAYPPAVRPTSTSCGMSAPRPMSTNTTFRSPLRSTAELGTARAERDGVESRTVAYIPGFSRPPVLATTTLARTARDAVSSVG